MIGQDTIVGAKNVCISSADVPITQKLRIAAEAVQSINNGKTNSQDYSR